MPAALKTIQESRTLCPYCSGPKTTVVETRKRRGFVFRVRECLNPECEKINGKNRRFRTYE